MAGLRRTVGVIPGPSEQVVMGRRGNLLAFKRDPLGYLQAARARYGPIGALIKGDDALLYALGPAYNRQLLDQPSAAVAQRDHALTRLLAPLHTPYPSENPPPQIEDAALHHIAVACSEAVLERWGMSQPIDVAYVMRRLTLRIALWSVWGIEHEADAAPLTMRLNRWGSILAATTFLRLPSRQPRWQDRRFGRLAVELEDDLLRLIRERGLGQTGADQTVADRRLAADLLAQFIALRECSCSALTWTILLLSQHPRVLYDLQAELGAVLQGGSPSLDQLERLPLLRRVIAESLRLLPPISVGISTCAAPTELGSYQLRSGTSVVYSPFVTHRTVEKFVAPARFRPERWLYLDPAEHEYLPFGLAPAIAAHAPQITMLVALVLAPLLQRFHLALAPGTHVDRARGYTLMPRRGLPMIIAPPDRALTFRPVRGNIRELVVLPEDGTRS